MVHPPGGRKPIPVGTHWTPSGGAKPCRECGAPIAFLELTAKGHWRPHDADGEIHFASCAARKKAKKRACPHCGSALFTTIYTDIPPEHYARAECVCGRSWWLARPEAER